MEGARKGHNVTKTGAGERIKKMSERQKQAGNQECYEKHFEQLSFLYHISLV